MNTLAFFVEKSAEHLEKGLARQQAGDLKAAHYNLLKAAEFLYKAAERSEASLKESRTRQAEAILGRAEAVGRLVKGQEGVAAPGGEGAQWLVTDRPGTRLDDVAGLEGVKEQIRIRMIYPFTHPELAQRFGIKKGGGILLYGPPGTGKTMLARAVAGEIDAAFFTVKPSEIMSKWVGEAEQNIARLFAAARQHQRAVIFIDEVEALIPKRSHSGSTVMQRVVPQLLSEMEGFSKDREGESAALLFMGATNEPWSLDEAVLRPGRFDEKVYVPLPDSPARRYILLQNLQGKPLADNVSMDELAELTEGYSGADVRRICEKASDIPFVDSVKTGEERHIERLDILTALHEVKPSVSPKTIERFEKLAF